MCRNGEYTERGIKQINGFMSERWRIEPEYAVKVDNSLGLLGVLLEPTTVVAKALEQVAAVGRRAHDLPRGAYPEERRGLRPEAGREVLSDLAFVREPSGGPVRRERYVNPGRQTGDEPRVGAGPAATRPISGTGQI